MLLDVCLLNLLNREGYRLRLALECVVLCALVAEVISLSDTSVEVARRALLNAFSPSWGTREERIMSCC